MRLMKSMRSKKLARSKKAAGSKQSRTFADRAGAIVAVLIVAFVAAAMLMAREPSSATATAPKVSTEMAEPTAMPSPSPVRSEARDAAVTATAASARPAEKAPETKAAPVTIVGCVQQDGEGFRLTKTSGADAPKARSWKSGFLRKGSANLELVDASGGLRLPSHVGQRVSVTGMLDDRELKARSLRRVSDSCN